MTASLYLTIVNRSEWFCRVKLSQGGRGRCGLVERQGVGVGACASSGEIKQNECGYAEHGGCEV